MKINLTRPLVFLDIESTGVDRENDRIIELSFCKINPDGNREIKTARFNPEIPIPAGATEVHGIKDEDVKDKPLFKQQAKGILSFLDGCDLAGFNSNSFDIPLLFNEFLRAGLYFDYKKIRMIDVGNIFKINEPRTLGAAVKLYCNREHEGAHGAEADVMATADVFISQLEKYADIPKDINELSLYSNFGNEVMDLSGKFIKKDGKVLLTFGKHRGQPADEHLDFLEWMVYKAAFNRDTIEIAKEILSITKPTPFL